MKRRNPHSRMFHITLRHTAIWRMIVIMNICAVMIFLIMACSGSDKEDLPYLDLFDPGNIAYVVGADIDDTDRVDTYRAIWPYYVDFENNLYIGDLYGLKIDKFNKHGQYILSFGRPGQGPGEFDYFPNSFCADSDGFVFAARKKHIDVFDAQGHYIEKILFPEEFKDMCHVMKADRRGNLFFLTDNETNEFQLIKYFRDSKTFITIYHDKQRAGLYGNNLLTLFVPGFEVDSQDNIYILDSVQYKVLKYSPDGKLINTFQKEAKRKKISEKDLNHFSLRGITNFPISYLTELRGESQYFPILCGINIDKDRIYLWRTEQDQDYKRIIDIYDLQFRPVGKSSYYNPVHINLIFFRKGLIYIPNFEVEDPGIYEQGGILGAFEEPYQIKCYRYEE